MFFLPPYSPELNPQECVNQDVKTNVIVKKRAIKKVQMKDNVNEFMRNRKKTGAKILSRKAREMCRLKIL